MESEALISNKDSDDDKSDTEVINQDNPVIVNNEEMAVVIHRKFFYPRVNYHP